MVAFGTPDKSEFARIHQRDVRRTPLLRVDWRDATSDQGWHYKLPKGSDGKLTLRVTSAGFLVHRTRDELTLATNISAGGKPGDLMTIPAAWITSVVVLKDPTWSKKGRKPRGRRQTVTEAMGLGRWAKRPKKRRKQKRQS
jgi:hypothetical protein